jgi:competence protein ComQ
LLSVDDPAFLPFKDYYAGQLNEDYLWNHKDQFVQMIHDSGCMEYSRVVQSVCVQKAEKIYEQLQAGSPWKEEFREVTFASYLNKAY